MGSQAWEDVLGIEMVRRPGKPRTSGITMIIDTCQPWQYEQGFLDQWADFIDWAKLSEAHLYQPMAVVQQKVDQFRRYDIIVQPGGVIIEIARAQGVGLKILDHLWEMGFEQIEVSSSAFTQREMDDEAQYLDAAKK